MRKKRKIIIEKIVRYIAQSDIESITFEDLARAAEMKRTALYYYFTSRELIFFHIWRKGWMTLWAGLRPLVPLLKTAPAREVLKQAMHAELQTLKNNPELIQALFRLHQNKWWWAEIAEILPAKTLEKAETVRLKYIRFYKTMLKKGMQSGEFRKMPLQSALRAIHGIVWGILRKENPIDEVDEKFLLELLEHVLLKHSSKP